MIFEKHPALGSVANTALARWLGCAWDISSQCWCGGDTALYALFVATVGEDHCTGDARFAMCNGWAVYITKDDHKTATALFICEFRDKDVAIRKGYTYSNGKVTKRVPCANYFKDAPLEAYAEPTYTYDTAIDSLLRMQLYGYQKSGVAKMRACRRVLNGDQMGLGKTIQALATVADMLQKGGSVLIVCPAFLKLNWALECEKSLAGDYLIGIVGGKGKYKAIDGTTQITITNYERLGKVGEFSQYGAVIVDEAHMLKNPLSQRVKLFQRLQAKYNGRLIFLTGTPIKNNIPELYNLVRWCAGGTLRMGTTEFCTKFSFPEDDGRGVVFRGVRNATLLKSIMRPWYIARKTEEAIDLPPITRQQIVKDLGGHEKHLHGELAQAYADFMDGVQGEHIMHIRQAVSGTKVADTVELALHILENGEQLVIWDCFKKPVALIAAAISGAVAVTGDVPAAERQSIVERFQRGAIRCLVATIPALNTGVTLTAATKCIFNSLDWVPAENLQAEKRIHRIGTTKPCTIYQMVKTGFDKKLLYVLNEKMNVIEKAL